MDSVARPVGCMCNKFFFGESYNIRKGNDMSRNLLLLHEYDLLMDLLVFDRYILDHSSDRPLGIVAVRVAVCHSIRRLLHTGGALRFCNSDCCCSVSCMFLRHRNDLIHLSSQRIFETFSANDNELEIVSER